MSIFSFLPSSLSSSSWFLGCLCIPRSVQPNILVLHLQRLHPESILTYTSSAHPCFVPQRSKGRLTEFSNSCRKLFHFKFHLILADSFQGEANYIALSKNKLTDWMNSHCNGKKGRRLILPSPPTSTVPKWSVWILSADPPSKSGQCLHRLSQSGKLCQTFLYSPSFSCHVSLYSHS